MNLTREHGKGDWKQGLGQAWESLAEGWRELRGRTVGALTRFLPQRRHDDGSDDAPDDEPPRFAGWALLAADVFDDGERIVVRLEAPGMRRDDFDVELRDQLLLVHGDKRFEHETRDGHWHLVQCAYGSFRRVVPLPAPVLGERARATYRAGVLRIELPKREPSRPKRIAVKVA